MSPYKSFIAAAKDYFQSVAFLKFLLTASIFIFAAGGLFYLLGLFIMSVYDAFVCLGSILIWAGLLLSIIKEDVMTIAISSGVISLGSLVGWIISLVGRSYFGYIVGGVFAFTPFIFFLIFGAIAVIVFIKAEKFRSMRAASAAARPAGMPCQRCGNVVPFGSGFCPACGAPAPQYAPPQQPQYAPPQQPQYAPPQQPVPPAAPAEPAASAPAAPAEPVASAPAAPAEPVASAPVGKKCVSCGAELPVDAVFCGKCGTKQE
jgi:hypothetical protein